MALSMKQKYERINLSKLPDNYSSEFKAIKDDTDNFDPELTEIFESNFNTLYSLVEKKHPEAIKKGGTVTKTKPATRKKPVAKKKAPAKKVIPKGKTFTPKSRGKKKPTSQPTEVEECRKILNEAGYTLKQKKSKDGKKTMKRKVVRQERSIIKDKVEDTFTTVLKDISGSEEKDKKYKEMQVAINEMKTLMTKLFNYLNNLAEDNSVEKVKKINSRLKNLLN